MIKIYSSTQIEFVSAQINQFDIIYLMNRMFRNYSYSIQKHNAHLIPAPLYAWLDLSHSVKFHSLIWKQQSSILHKRTKNQSYILFFLIHNRLDTLIG